MKKKKNMAETLMCFSFRFKLVQLELVLTQVEKFLSFRFKSIAGNVPELLCVAL